jgi:hypothetical protein
MRTLVAALTLFTFAVPLSASQEGILPFSSFHLESSGIGESGKVVVEGRQDANEHLIELRILAFGKVYQVPADKLALLADLPSNGIRISYERGYVEMGGRVIYVQLQMGFTSFTKKDVFISVTESGEIKVGQIQYHGA